MRTHIGPYRLEAPLGRGGMGVVYQGTHEHLGRPVAIKALAPELTQQPEFKERFFAEAKTQARLQHPNIVGVYDLLEDAGEYFIVMEYVAGEGLDDRIKAAGGRPVDLAEAVGVISQVLSALDYAHSEGVIHRDIKPSNVLITSSGRIKLTDFGIALLIGDKRLTASQSAIGTPTYMSPEQIARPRAVDHRTDIYSAAVVLFEMLAGRPPFEDETEYGIKKLHVEAAPPDLMALCPGLPPGLVHAVTAALAKTADGRFASAGLFLRALQEAVPQAAPQGATPLPAPVYRATTVEPSSADPAPGAPPVSTARPHPSGAGVGAAGLFQGKNRWIALAAAAVLVLAVGIGGLFPLLSGGNGEEQVTQTGATPTPAGPSPAAGPAAGAGLALPPGAVAPAPASPAEPAPALLGAPAPPVPASRPVLAAETAPPPAVKTPKRTVAPELPPAPPVASEPAPEPAPEPTSAVRDPAPPVEEPKSSSPATAGVDQFKEMEALVVNIANLSEQAFEAYEKEGREDALLTGLDDFYEAATATRREFRKATGTGLRGTFTRVIGKAGDNRALQIKVDDLSRRSADIDRLIGEHAPGETIRAYWREIQSKLRKLSGYF